MTTEEAEALRGMSEREIRRAQDIVRAQLPLAHAQGNTKALTKLHEWEDLYGAEMRRRLDEGLVS